MVLIAAIGCAREKPESGRVDGFLVLRDAAGIAVSIDRPVRRIVSLAPNLTELVYASGAGDLLVGRTRYCNYPAGIVRAPVVSDLSVPDYERMVSLDPDIVLMTFAGNSGSVHRKLRDLGLNVFVLATDRVDGIIKAIDTIRALTGMPASSGIDSRALADRVDSVRQRTARRPPVTVFVVLDRSPLMTVSGGFVDEMITIAGGRNIARGNPTRYPMFSREEVLRADPDVIIIPTETFGGIEELVAAFPEWRDLRAVRQRRVYSLPSDVLLRPGPRVVDAVERLAEVLG